MGNSYLKLPEQRNYQQAYELAYKLAGEQLARIDDIEQQCRKAGARYEVINSQKVISIKYLNRSYLVTIPEAEVSLADRGEPVPIRDKVLILHYLISAKGTPLADKPVTYKELPGGHVYFPTFSKRITRPILKNFGHEPHLLLEAAERLGGRKADYGDMSVTIDAFSRVPITIYCGGVMKNSLPRRA